MNIELNENQYNEIIYALEFYMRFYTGQLSFVLEEFDSDKKDEAQNAVNSILGIQFGDYRTKGLAYEISRTMLYEKNKRDGVQNVHSSPPLKCTDEPLIRITM